MTTLRTSRDLIQRRDDRARLVLPGKLRQQTITTIIIAQGNKILDADACYGTIYGGKNAAAAITTVPSASPSLSAGGTYTDGLCAGSLLESGSTSPVWVANKVNLGGGGPDLSDTTGTLIEGMLIMSRYRVQLPISGGGGAVADVFLPWYIG
jgi:hypothetical protein